MNFRQGGKKVTVLCFPHISAARQTSTLHLVLDIQQLSIAWVQIKSGKGETMQ